MKNLPWVILILVLLLMVVQCIYFYPRLPETMASHYNAAGKADDFMDKSAFMLFYALSVVIMLILLLLLPLAIYRYLPATWINLPHKDYWLAEDRSEATRVYLFRQMVWIADATFVFLLSLMQTIFRANLRANPDLSAAALWVPVVVFLLFVLGWVIGFILKFYQVPAK